MSGGRYLIATRNAAKARELLPILSARGFDAVDLAAAGVAWSPAEERIESLDSFSGNALAKARYFNEQTGTPTFADDSGLVVPLLGGAPGVRSRRWSERPELSGAELDAANSAALITALETRGGWPRPLASFVCAAAYCNGAMACVRLGETRGHLLREPRGSGGFGYDPHFLSDELGMSFGEASSAAKALVSHRTRAFAALVSALDSLRVGGAGC